MIRKLFRIATVIFAIVGLGTTLWFLRPLLMKDEPDSVTSIPSPDGTYKAILSEWAGGGAISPYCYKRLTVVPVLMPVAKQSSSKMAVFAADCTGDVLSSGENFPSVHWESNTRLKVKFSIADTTVSPTDFTLRKQDETGDVAIEFEMVK